MVSSSDLFPKATLFLLGLLWAGVRVQSRFLYYHTGTERFESHFHRGSE